jgi:pimeloyl-ACP methyl ester carboxylesterase
MPNTQNDRGLWREGRLRANGFRQFYRDWQPGEERALPVLALHGSLTQSGMWHGLAERLGSVRMLCPDLRGYGRSEDPQGDACAEFAGDVLALAAALLPPRFVAMGHSFACSIALELANAAAARVAGVVLVDPVVRVPGVPAPSGPPAPHPESFASIEEAERHFAATEEGEWTAAALARFARDVMIEESGRWRFPYRYERLKRLRTFTVSSASDYDLLAKARLVKAPVLVFRGGASKRFAAAAEEPFAAAFAAPPEVVLCPRSGHFPGTSEPGIVAAALLEFLARLSARSG